MSLEKSMIFGSTTFTALLTNRLEAKVDVYNENFSTADKSRRISENARF